MTHCVRLTLLCMTLITFSHSWDTLHNESFLNEPWRNDHFYQIWKKKKCFSSKMTFLHISPQSTKEKNLIFLLPKLVHIIPSSAYFHCFSTYSYLSRKKIRIIYYFGKLRHFSVGQFPIVLLFHQTKRNTKTKTAFELQNIKIFNFNIHTHANKISWKVIS